MVRGIGAYGLLLVMSFMVRAARRGESDDAPALGPLDRSVMTQAADGPGLTSAPVRIVYREYTPSTGEPVTTILLLHGSPGRKEDFRRLAPILAQHSRVIVPDLPGFGSSTRAVPDYSFRAHGIYAKQLLDQLAIERVHVLGFSMGGGVALSLIDLAPDRVASLTMLSAIGVQEMELTGNYSVNHLVHGVQLAALWLLREGTPHLGSLDDVMLGVPYARNFFDSDQRPLRATLRRVNVPTLILHGTNDGLVPIEAAREHARLIPQSELFEFDGDHFLLFARVEELGDRIADFVGRASHGLAPGRAAADPERVRAAIQPFGTNRFPPARGIAAAVLAGLLAAGAMTFALAVGIVRHGTTVKGRRLLLSSWRRLTRWEFWPPWVFYPPLLIYIGFLMVKYRSATLFTAANPAIVGGGFVGESKYAILQALSGAGPFVARSRLIAAALSDAEKLSEGLAFMAEEALSFPVILKPNQGQRGSGVVVVRSLTALQDCLARSSVDTIIQEHVAGAEYGVFYYRRPAETCGHIFSVTEKTFPTVTGDGRQTLESLILADDRAVCVARLLFERHHDRLRHVPGAGESVPLVDLGSHCRGAMFLNGQQVLTPALERRFDAIARGFAGFYFGRFDVRAVEGVEAFRDGRGFKIIELNGVTSEATHIYHPGTPLTTAYRVLMEQWRIAFEIGAENRRRGAALTSVRALVTLTRDYGRTARAHLH